MRYLFILAVLSCLLALCRASTSYTRLVILKNATGKVETFSSNDNKCRTVGSSFKGKLNYAAVYGGQTIYYKDSKCKDIAHLDLSNSGIMFTVKYPIQAYRAL
ncbi:hypothetical protein GGI21_005674 [Coemansia aciculifera]|nr:hypothetical protein GGI21_005674 [Coemansia aciculifera]